MAAEKLSISMDVEMAAAVREAARKADLSVSAWFAQAAEAQLRHGYLREALAAADEEFGPIDPAEAERLVAEARKSSIVTGTAGAA